MVAESKEQAIKQLPLGKRFRKDTYEDEDAYEEMVVAKARLLKDYPFWGILGLRLVLVETDALPTLATDGMHVFYNSDFVKSLSRGERVFAMGHELYHCLFNHAGHVDKIRLTGRDNSLFGFAADFVVNDGLYESNIGEFITTINILHDKKFRGFSTEDVYDYLVEHPEEVPQNAQTLDTHIEIEVVDDDAMGDGKDGDGKGNGNRFRMSRSEFEKLKSEWQESIVQAATAQKEAEQLGKAAGCIPAGIQQFIDDLVKPKMNWKQALRRYVRRIQHRAYSFARPNKALFNQGFTIPGFRSYTNKLDIAIAVDASGSVSRDQLTAFISEMDGILKSFVSYNIRAWCFDGDVIKESVTILTKQSGMLDDITKFIQNIKGGGGTDFMSNWEYMKDEGLKPRLLLFLTDGYPFGDWGEPLYCPTIFFIMGNDSRVKAPFGITIHYEEL